MKSALILSFLVVAICGGCNTAKRNSLRPYEKYHLLNRACVRDDVMGVEIMLRVGADPRGLRDYGTGDEIGIEFSSPLEAAVWSDSDETEIILMLLRHGADPNQKGTERVTPLGWALQEKKEQKAKVLIEYGAKEN